MSEFWVLRWFFFKFASLKKLASFFPYFCPSGISVIVKKTVWNGNLYFCNDVFVFLIQNLQLFNQNVNWNLLFRSCLLQKLIFHCTISQWNSNALSTDITSATSIASFGSECGHDMGTRLVSSYNYNNHNNWKPCTLINERTGYWSFPVFILLASSIIFILTCMYSYSQPAMNLLTYKCVPLQSSSGCKAVSMRTNS